MKSKPRGEGEPGKLGSDSNFHENMSLRNQLIPPMTVSDACHQLVHEPLQKFVIRSTVVQQITYAGVHFQWGTFVFLQESAATSSVPSFVPLTDIDTDVILLTS